MFNIHHDVKCRDFVEAFEHIRGRIVLFLVHWEVVVVVFNPTWVSIFFNIFMASDKGATLFFYLSFSQNVDLC